MKKYFFGAIVATAISAVALNINFNANSDSFSDTFLANVEALAGNENGDGKGLVICYGSDITCILSGDFTCCK